MMAQSAQALPFQQSTLPNSTDGASLPLAMNGRFLTRPMTGVDRVASELTRALSRKNSSGQAATDLRFLMPKTPEPLEENLDASGEDYHFETASRASGHLWEQFVLPRMVRDDEWLLNLCNTGPLTFGRQACMIHDAQFITQAASYSWKFRTLYQTMMPRLAAKADVLLTVSEFSRLELEAHGVFPKNKAVVIHNGCDHMDRIVAAPDALALHGLEAGKYFIVLGSRAAHKNLEMLLKIATESAFDYPIAVVGGGGKEVFKSVGFAETPRVKLLGRVEDEALKSLLENATALLFPSKTEGFGLPPLEAMRCGCPVVATTGGAVPEVCADAPLYAHPEKPEEWAQAMQHLIDSPDALEILRQRGSAHSEQFTWSSAADKIVETLRDASVVNR